MNIFIIIILATLSILCLFDLYNKLIGRQYFLGLLGIKSVKNMRKILDIPHSYRRLVLSRTVLAGNTNLAETLVDTEISAVGQLVHTSSDSQIVFLYCILLLRCHPPLFLIVAKRIHTSCVLLVVLVYGNFVLYVHFVLDFEVLNYLKVFVVIQKELIVQIVVVYFLLI